VSFNLQLGAGVVEWDRDEVTLDPSWWSWSGAHGGLLVAETVRHAARVLDIDPSRSLRSVSVQLLSTVDRTPVRLVPELFRSGGSATSVGLRAEQGGEVRLIGHAVFGADRAGGLSTPAIAPPRVVPVEAAAPVPFPPELVPFGQHFEFRSAGGPLPLVEGNTAGDGRTAQLTAWFRMTDPALVDAAQAVLLLDAMAPAIYATLHRPVAVPTLDYTVHLHAPLDAAPLASGAWVLGRQRCLAAADGWAVDDGSLWDEGGRLIATSRQLRRVLGRPR
jgi:acyl-CoA thioesterase